MTEREIGWLAGIVDGEGYIAIHKIWSNDRSHYRFSIRLVVTNTNFNICQRCRDLCGGNIYAKKQVKNCKVVYQWYIYGVNRIVDILKTIKDDLIQKRAIAELVITFGELFNRKGGYGKRVPFKIEEEQYLLYQTALRLNRRGNSEPSPKREGVETM